MPHSLPKGSPARRHGFSFVELLFAVAVMGIGFIMIAAVFPIGLQQTKVTLDETAAAANSRTAVGTLEQIAQTAIQYASFGSPPTPSNSVSGYPVTMGSATVSSTQVPLKVGQTVANRTIPGQVRSFRDPRPFFDPYGNQRIHDDTIWNRLSAEFINKSDPRNASVVLFKRDLDATNNAGAVTATPAGSVQLIVINTQCTTQAEYTAADVKATAAQALYNLEPRPVGVTIEKDANGVSLATFTAVTAAQGFPASATLNAVPSAVVEGAFVVISDDQITAPVLDVGRMNGRIYRVGTHRVDISADTWELAPGYELTTDYGADGAVGGGDDITKIGVTTLSAGSNVTVNGPAVAFVIGRGFEQPTAVPGAGGRYSGPAQDVATYTTFIKVKQ